MEKMLGKHYKWWYLLNYTFKAGTVYRTSVLSWITSSFLTVIATVLLWYINIQSGSNLFNFSNIFTYYIVGNLFVLTNSVEYAISEDILSGSITTKLLRPSNIWLQWFIGNLGWNLFRLVVIFCIYSLVALIGRQWLIFPASVVDIVYFVLSCIIGYSITIAINYICGMLAFFFLNIWGIIDLKNSLRFYLSGSFMALNIVSFTIWLTYLPFSFTFYHPMQIYLGLYNFEQILIVLGGSLTWCIVLWYFAYKLFVMGLKKNESVGL